ncbi:MAG: LytTR family DNA-binding domain-containing protein [Myxococcota bacterium]
MKLLIVDDEPLAQRRMQRMLASIDGMEVVGVAGDGDEARTQVEALQPDVVLLDIDMPECDGLTLAATAELPAVIFVTAHREHALEAFELDAVDYLLKPVSKERLVQALSRVATRQGAANPSDVVTAVRDAVAEERRAPRLTARAGDTMHVFDARAVARLHARDKVTMFWVEGTEYVLDESLAELERRLAAWDFLRVHRSELINLDAVVSVRFGAGESSVTLRDGAQAPVSRRMLAELKKRLRGS